FIRRFTRADGVISTRPNLVRRAKELGLFSVLRVFVIDSMALGNVARQTAQSAPDVIEILPGVMPKVVKRLREEVRLPLVVGGLVADKEDVMAALSAGALAVSTTDEALWAE
ncbi:MAG: glycerol-3-phosphate responsive antiterminator, partial [Oscillospiraceae bacterium]|nr:glycerol-3-phosphate responsive antiterminator [Oscillospiraceae bacterium]